MRAVSLPFLLRAFVFGMLHSLFTELAYQKQKDERLGSDPARERRTHELREIVRLLSRLDPLVVSGKITPGKLLPPPLPPTRRLPPPLPGRG